MHKHEWVYQSDGGSAEWWSCGCGEQLTPSDVTDRLNATEELSAEDANFVAEALQEATNVHGVQQGFGRNPYCLTDALRAYAEVLDE